MPSLRPTPGSTGAAGALLRAIPALVLSGLLAACTTSESIHSLHGESMGSTWTVRFVGRSADLGATREAVEQRLALIDQQMSTWKPDSDLSRFNNASAGSWHTLPPELFEVVDAALDLASASGGAYDPTVGPLVDLWGFGPAGNRREPPASEAVDAMRKQVGWERVQRDAPERRVFQDGSVHIDLSSIAPGYALDMIGDYLESQGIHDYLVEVGGELRARGVKPDGDAWQVAIQRPLENDSADGSITPQHVIGLRDASLGSSGDYRNFFEDAGRRYAHRIDPRRGYPLDNGIASVTVMSAMGIDADPLATALSVLGVKAGLEFANRRGLAVLFIVRTDEGFEEVMTPPFAALLAR
ncbi:FAD:protein FMN transferase [Dokdonella sp.]|uniref:FAD:protein FMN transferase n=1 Tax=Dokdonella sp. TaxID=2291710 RepID=UPI003C333095